MVLCIIFTLLLLVVSLHHETHAALGQLARRESEPTPRFRAKQECPTWFTGNRSRGCECHEVPGVVCHTNYALMSIENCMTIYPKTEQLQTAYCPLHFASDKSDYVKPLHIRLPENSSNVNDYFCAGLKRTGVLCSKCQTGLGPPVLSYGYKCVQCLPSPYGWFLYIFLACFPTTVFSLLVFLFQVKANSPQLNILVFACQYLALVMMHDLQGSIDALGITVITFYSFWNLEFFRYVIPAFCISDRMSLVDVYALEYLVATFPLFLVLLIYVTVQLHARGCKILVYLWKPFRICCTRTQRWMDPRGSIIHVFATFLMLSYTKLVIVSLYLIRYIYSYRNDGKKVGPKLVYLDPSTHYYSTKYLPFIFLSGFVVSVLVVLPVLFLCLYPLRPFQRCLNRCGLSWHALHAFADSFNGHYKNRTDNTYDCRYFGSFYLVLRIVAFVAFILGRDYLWLVQITTGVVAMFLLLSLRPYKDEIFNIMDSFFFGIWIITTAVDLYYADTYINRPLGFYCAVVLIPLIYLVVLVTLRFIIHTTFYNSRFLNFQRARNLIERFVGYQSRDNGGTGTNREDSDFAHRLVYPAEYRPVSYGAINS